MPFWWRFFFGKHVESWMGMMVLGSDSCGLWANRPSWNTCIPAKQTCRKVLLETCWRPLLLIIEIEFLFTTPTKQYMNARIPASSPKQLGRWRRLFDWVANFLPITFVCLRWLFTLYHGRSPLDHHFGRNILYFTWSIFSKSKINSSLWLWKRVIFYARTKGECCFKVKGIDLFLLITTHWSVNTIDGKIPHHLGCPNRSWYTGIKPKFGAS